MGQERNVVVWCIGFHNGRVVATSSQQRNSPIIFCFNLCTSCVTLVCYGFYWLFWFSTSWSFIRILMYLPCMHSFVFLIFFMHSFCGCVQEHSRIMSTVMHGFCYVWFWGGGGGRERHEAGGTEVRKFATLVPLSKHVIIIIIGAPRVLVCT